MSDWFYLKLAAAILLAIGVVWVSIDLWRK